MDLNGRERGVVKEEHYKVLKGRGQE